MVNLLYVPEINHFTIVGDDQTADSVQDNYQKLQDKGVPLEEKVLLLSTGKMLKYIRDKEHLKKNGFTLQVYPLLQLFEELEKGAKQAETEGPIAMEEHYRNMAAKCDDLSGYALTDRLTLFDHVVGYMKGCFLIQYRSITQIEQLEVQKGSYEEKIKKSTLESLKDIRNLYQNLLNGSIESITEVAEKNNTYGVEVYPHDGNKNMSGWRVSLIETPNNPGSLTIKKMIEEGLTTKNLEEIYFKQKFGHAILGESLKLWTNPEPFEKTIAMLSNPSLIITDTYAFEVFPEIKDWQISVLNKYIDIKGLEFR
jgi:hypothetical protein